MSDKNIPHERSPMSCVSAWMDGEETESMSVSWADDEREAYFYFSLTRQVIRHEAFVNPVADSYQRQRQSWLTFWSRVDSL
jgi:hypothetical protein